MGPFFSGDAVAFAVGFDYVCETDAGEAPSAVCAFFGFLPLDTVE